VQLTVLRSGAEQTITLTLGELPNVQQARIAPDKRETDRGTVVPRLGLTLAPGEGGAGVVITNIEPGGIAAEHGLRNGDVIMEIAGKPVSSPAEVRDTIADAQKGGRRTILVRVKTGDAIRFVAMRLARA
jgi:serine protease Do